MTPYEVNLAYEGWLENEEMVQKMENYRAREIAYTVYQSIPLKKGHSHVSIDRFWPIDTKVKELPSKEERMKIYKEKFGKKKA